MTFARKRNKQRRDFTFCYFNGQGGLARNRTQGQFRGGTRLLSGTKDAKPLSSICFHLLEPHTRQLSSVPNPCWRPWCGRTGAQRSKRLSKLTSNLPPDSPAVEIPATGPWGASQSPSQQAVVARRNRQPPETDPVYPRPATQRNHAETK